MTTGTGTNRRPLRPEERRENSLDHWLQLMKYMDAIMLKAATLRQYAEKRYQEVEGGKRW